MVDGSVSFVHEVLGFASSLHEVLGLLCSDQAVVTVWSVHVSDGTIISIHFKPPIAEKLLVSDRVATPLSICLAEAVKSEVDAMVNEALIVNLPVAVMFDITGPMDAPLSI